MPETVWRPSPLAGPLGAHIGADIGIADPFTGDVFNIIDVPHADIGSVLKGLQKGSFFVLFEIDEPSGTVFTSVEFSLYDFITFGALGTPFNFGVLAKDGIWNINPESSPKGLGDYVLAEDFPRPLSDTDAAWVSGTAAIVGILDVFVHPVGGTPNRVTWGSTGLGSDFEAGNFLTDFQTAFDENESDRTIARGVPVLLYIQSISPFSLGTHRFSSQNDPVEANHPTLTLNVSDAVDPGTIYTVIAKSSQIRVSSGVAQVSITAKPLQANVTAKTLQASVIAKPSQANVVAKVDAIDVVEKPSQINVTKGVAQVNLTAKPGRVDLTAKPGQAVLTAKPGQAVLTAKTDAIDVVEKPDTIDVTGA